jgi:hypothetical protein
MTRVGKFALALAFAIALMEAVSYLFARALVPQGLVITPPNKEGYEDYLEFRDPVLGWPRPDAIGNGEIDRWGSRIVPNFPERGMEICVSAYGDSFTWGDEVTPEHSYPNVLAALIDCRVDNFGVGGYGTDQAFLRYQHNVEDRAPVVVLGHFSENIVRNVNQLRGFYAPGRFGFKPRFIAAADGSIDLVTLPGLSVEQYLQVHKRTRELLPHEYFVPDELGGPSVLDFPYTFVVGQTFFHYRIRSALVGRPSYAPFYDIDHPSKALEVSVGILKEFSNTARARNQQPVILIIPDMKDLTSLHEQGSAPYDPLAKTLIEDGINVLDGGRAITEMVADQDFCRLYVDCQRGSHFNVDGYALLASIVYQHLTMETN